jgi:hypothetical protein
MAMQIIGPYWSPCTMMTVSTGLGLQNDFFFKVQQEFVQEFACDQSWILSFSVFWMAAT